MLREKIQPNLEPFENQLEDIKIDGKYLPLKKVVETDLHSNIDVAYGSMVELIDFIMDVDTMVHQSGGKEVTKEFLSFERGKKLKDPSAMYQVDDNEPLMVVNFGLSEKRKEYKMMSTGSQGSLDFFGKVASIGGFVYFMVYFSMALVSILCDVSINIQTIQAYQFLLPGGYRNREQAKEKIRKDESQQEF